MQNRLFLAISLLLLAGGGVLTSSTMAQAPGIDPATVALTSTDETTLGRRLLMLISHHQRELRAERWQLLLPMR